MEEVQGLGPWRVWAEPSACLFSSVFHPDAWHDFPLAIQTMKAHVLVAQRTRGNEEMFDGQG